MITIKTANKIALARLAYRAVMLARRAAGSSWSARVERGGVRWALDLREGIDFSIYLLGAFEPATQRLYRRTIRPGDHVFDIGANIGSHTLPLARLVGPEGHVTAFEPTEYAMGKLKANMELNPELAARITLKQTMLAATGNEILPASIFASWPLVAGSALSGLHPEHRGRAMQTSGATVATLDRVVEEAGVTRLNFIKLDVDGNEPAVLSGGLRTLRRFRPMLLMEISPGLFDDDRKQFDGMIALLREAQYWFSDANTGQELPVDAQQLRGLIPQGASRNVLARPRAAVRSTEIESLPASGFKIQLPEAIS